MASAAARRCSGKKRSKKLQLFSLIYEEKTDFQAFSTRFCSIFLYRCSAALLFSSYRCSARVF
jgi:hypothetical protein